MATVAEKYFASFAAIHEEYSSKRRRASLKSGAFVRWLALTALKLPCWSTNVVGREVCDVTLMLSVRRMQVLSLYVNRSQKRPAASLLE